MSQSPERDGSAEEQLAEALVAVSRRIEAIASRAAEDVEAVFFGYAKELRLRAAGAAQDEDQ